MSKTIGIIGGMGPNASARLYELIIHKAQDHYQASKNSAYPHVLIDSIPVPEFISSKPTVEAKRMLGESIDRLYKAGSSYIGIACNTAHLLLPKLQKHTVSIVHMPEEVALYTSQRGYRSATPLATSSTLGSQIYHQALSWYGVSLKVPSHQYQIDQHIRDIIAGSKKGIHKINKYIEGMPSTNAIILGCTELSLAGSQLNKPNIISSLDILADTLLKRYYNKE